MKALSLVLLALAPTAHAGANLPISFTETVCPGGFPATFNALTQLNEKIYGQLSSCTGGVFEHSGSSLAIKRISIETHFSHMCTGGEVLVATVEGTCVIP